MGSHRVTYDLNAHLPEGKYSIGFACTESLPSGSRDLLWHDKLCEFEVFTRVTVLVWAMPIYQRQWHLYKQLWVRRIPL